MSEIEVYGTVSTVEVRDELPIHRAALGNVPGFRPGDDPYFGVRDGLLASAKTKNTRIAYSQDLAAWKSWCDHLGVHPFAARRHDVDLWSRYMAEHPQPHTGRPASPATINRKLSAIANFYKYGIEDVELLTYSPVTNVKRETVGEDSPTSGLSAVQLDHFLTAAENESPTAAALMSLLIYNGLRIGEALPCTIRDFRHDAGHRVLFIVRKGCKPAKVPLSPVVVRALELAISDRDTGPIFLGPDNDKAMDYQTGYRMVRRLARKAGIPGASSITPHSLRHSFATELLGSGVPLQDVQDAMGHADPRTTRRYDRSRHSLDRHATYKMAAHFAAVRQRRHDDGLTARRAESRT